LVVGFGPTLVTAESAPAQTFTVLYTFTSTTDGEQPDAPLTMDAAGNLYGTTQYGGTKGGFGTVFKLDSTGKETVLRSFAGTPDAEDPYSGLTRDKAGNLYGTTLYGGTKAGFGTVFKLRPGARKPYFTASPGLQTGKIPAQFWFVTRRATCTAQLNMAVRMADSEPCSSWTPKAN
jgi:uncharacterized repeat protein (TIGR03803 family)